MQVRTANGLFGTSVGPQLHVALEDNSQIADSRRQAMRLVETLHFEKQPAANFALALTEAATNVLKHATRGHLLIRPLQQADYRGIEILALDKGRGIPNIGRSLRDGYSTAGSLGAGMSAFARLSSAWDLYSDDKGTALRLEFWSGGRPPPGIALQIGAVCLPKAGETANGDTWAIRESDDSFLVLVADGLGHGPDAAKASASAVDILATARGLAPAPLMDAIHRGIGSTRGAAVGLTLLEPGRQIATFAGVGNVAAMVCAPGVPKRHLVSRNGIVGHNVGTVREMNAALPLDALLVTHSDGLGTHWDLEEYPGLHDRHPALVAGVLWRDFTRNRDDVTVLAIRNGAGTPMSAP